MANQSESSQQSRSASAPTIPAQLRKRSSQDGTSQLDEARAVSGRWLVKAMLATLVAAGLALYLTVCLLFYQGQWQFVFFPHGPHNAAAGENWLSGSWARRGVPVRATETAPASAASVAASSGLPIGDHRFDYTEEGVAQLDGWWIAAENAGDKHNLSASQPSTASSTVVLFCPNGRSDLSQNLAAFHALHSLGVSIFAFDYRGFGASQRGHPSQQKAYRDGTAALHYLTAMRHIDPRQIVVYGAEVGAAVAVHVAQQSPQIAGVILENPQPSFVKQVKREQHIHALPMWLIFRDRFDISRMVPSLKMPKLIIATPAKPEYIEGATAIYKEAFAPKQIVRVNPGAAASLYIQPEWQQAMRDFLNSTATVRTTEKVGN